jgi:hypothetical protein
MTENVFATTIIIATNNNRNTVGRALDSIAGNSKKPNLIILGDNDSEDGTYDLVCKKLGMIPIMKTKNGKPVYSSNHETMYKKIPIIIFSKPAKFLSEILNICLKISFPKTALYGFLSPTDWYGDTTIEEATEIVQTHPYVSCLASNTMGHCEDSREEYLIVQSYDSIRRSRVLEYKQNFFVPALSFQKIGNGFNEKSEQYWLDMIAQLSKIGLIYHDAKFLHHCEV